MALFTNNNRPQVSIEGDTPPIHYLRWRFAKVGDIVFNTEPKPGELDYNGTTTFKRGYIGYMCVQDGIPEIDDATEYVAVQIDSLNMPVRDSNGITIVDMAQDAKWKCFGKILTLLLFCLLLQNSYAQGFLRTYPYGQHSGDYIKGLLEQSDTTYFATVNNDTLQLWVLDKEGHVMSQRNMQTPSIYPRRGGRLIPTADGNYIMTEYPYISKINLQGDSIWYKNATGRAIILPNNNIAQPDNLDALCPANNLDEIATYGFHLRSPEGNLLADTILPIEAPDCWMAYLSEAVANSENALLVGRRVDFYYQIPYVDIAKVSITNFGQVLWRNAEITGIAFDVVELPDSSYLVATVPIDIPGPSSDSLRIIKYLANGTIAWQRTVPLDYPPYLQISNAYFLKSYHDNEFILSVNNVSRIVAIDSAANVLWLKKPPLYSIFDSIYNINYYHNARVVYQDGDNYLVSGLFSTLDNHYIPFLARLDSSGNCTPKANFGLVQQDSLLTLTNTSFGADSYQWLWGNGAGLQDTIKQSTQYIYPQTGIYHVCLVAHNLCGNDTLCQTINYGVADGLHNALPTTPFSIANNPISAPTIQLIHPPLPTAATATVCNLNGQVLLQQTLSVAQANSHINIALLPAGIYLLQIKGQNIWWQQKVVVVK